MTTAIIDPGGVVRNIAVGDVEGLPAGWKSVPIPPGTVVDIGYTFTAPNTWTFGQTTQQIQGANLATINQNIANALARLRQIQTQVTSGKTQTASIAAKAAYATANLANLQDMQTDVKTLANALGNNANGANVFDALNDVATDLIGVARILSQQFDGTT